MLSDREKLSVSILHFTAANILLVNKFSLQRKTYRDCPIASGRICFESSIYSNKNFWQAFCKNPESVEIVVFQRKPV